MKFLLVGSAPIAVGIGVMVMLVYLGVNQESKLRGFVLGTTETTLTKQFTWTPTEESDIGDHPITIAAADTQGESITKEVTVTVAAPTPTEPEDTYISIEPHQGTFEVGEEFTITLTLHNPAEPVAAILADITYSDALDYVRADATGSIFEQELLTNTRTQGQLQFARATLGEPFGDSAGIVLGITFRTIREGNASVTIYHDTSSVITATSQENILQRVESASANVTGFNQFICFQLTLQEREAEASQAISPVIVEILDVAGERVRRQTTVSGADGIVHIADSRVISRLAANTSYSVIITPAGHLPIRLEVTDIFNSDCHNAGQAPWGDINGDGELNEADMNRIIQYYNGRNNGTLQTLFPNYTLTLPDIVQFIGNLRQHTPSTSPTPTP